MLWLSRYGLIFPMSGFRLNARALVLLVCLASLLVRIGGVHLHFCMDGTEPPVGIHLNLAEPLSLHDDIAQYHSDWDSVFVADATAPSVEKSTALTLLVVLSVLLLSQPQGAGIRLPLLRLSPVGLPKPRRLRPPVRAPPH